MDIGITVVRIEHTVRFFWRLQLSAGKSTDGRVFVLLADRFQVPKPKLIIRQIPPWFTHFIVYLHTGHHQNHTTLPPNHKTLP